MRPTAPDEDIHTYVIRLLKERAGELADKIHTGRSRNEQVSLDTRLWLRGEIDGTLGLLLADECAVGFRRQVSGRDRGRLHAHAPGAAGAVGALSAGVFRDVRPRLGTPDAGEGARQPDAAGLRRAGRQRVPVDREELARDLGFDGITCNSMDVSGDRDFALDFLSAASMTMLHLSRLAEDWILYSSDEFGWLELGDGVTSGSSLMPQKKNPDSLELMRGKCGRVLGAFTSLFTTMKGLPMTYNRDMQEDKEPLFDAADQLAMTLEMARVVVETTQLRPAPPRRAAEEGWLVATDLAEALARSGRAVPSGAPTGRQPGAGKHQKRQTAEGLVG